MRTSLIIFGVIFLVIGALLYFVPIQQIKANTSTTDGDNTDIRTSSVSLKVPVEWAFATEIIGFILLIFGVTVPNSDKRKEITEELADIMFFVLRFAQRYDVDLSKEIEEKIKKSAVKYPIEKAKGSNKKYTEF